MMTINSGNGAAGNVQSVRANMNMQSDSVSKNIQDQIMNAQKQLQELGANKDMTPEEKMKKRQEIQQEITNLNQQLRQHQIEQRKEQQSKNTSAKENNNDNQKTDTAKQATGFSSAGMAAILSADSSMKQAKVQGSVATKMEGRAGVLESEIKLDSARGGDTSAKQAELAETEQKAESATNAQLNTLAEASQTLTEAAKADQTDNKTDSENKNGKTDQTADDRQQIYEVSQADSEDKDIKAAAQSLETSSKTEDMITEIAEENSRPTAKQHIDVYL